MPNVQMPDGKIVQFPDTMKTEEINAVLDKQYGGKSAPAAAPEQGSGLLDKIGGAVKDYLKTDPEHPLAKGILHGLNTVGIGALQTVLEGGQKIRELTGMKSNQENVDSMRGFVAENRKGFESENKGSLRGKLGEMVGNTLPFLPLGGGTGGFINKVTTMAGQGGVIGALQPTTGEESRSSNALTGMAAGGGTAALLGAPFAVAKTKILPKQTENKLIQSALKPSTTMKQSVKDEISETMLQKKIPVSQGGLNKEQARIGDINKEIDTVISGKGKFLTQDQIMKQLEDLKAHYQNTKALPGEYVDEVQKVIDEFSQRPKIIMAEEAQAFKKDLHKELKGFYEKFQRYGVAKPEEWGEVRAKMASAFREGLVDQFPELSALNKEEGALLEVNKVLERAVGRIKNTNLIKLIPAVLSGGVSLKKYVGTLLIDHPYIKSKLAMAIRDARQKPSIGGVIPQVSKAAAVEATQSDKQKIYGEE